MLHLVEFLRPAKYVHGTCSVFWDQDLFSQGLNFNFERYGKVELHFWKSDVKLEKKKVFISPSHWTMQHLVLILASLVLLYYIIQNAEMCFLLVTGVLCKRSKNGKLVEGFLDIAYICDILP